MNRSDVSQVCQTPLNSSVFATLPIAKMNLLKAKNESDWYPHGCVRLDLSELWLGQTALEFYVPVVPGHAGEVMSGKDPM